VAEEKKTVIYPDLDVLLEKIIEANKAGSPTDEQVFWIDLKPWQIAVKLKEEHQITVSNGLVKRKLKSMGYRYRKQSKQLATGKYANRNAQFNAIFTLILLMSLGCPLLSIDCKKKENIGNLYRSGKCYTTQPIEVLDHDYEHLSQGKVIPHGIYDLQENKGYISIGNSSETADFVLDNLLWWWWEYGIHKYTNAKYLILLCDAGGANSYRHHIFKHRLMKFAAETGLTVMVSHYPPYCSKWNPIEHRLFCHVHKAMEGVIFDKYETVQMLIANTSTKTGLKVFVRLNLKEYQKGIKVNKTDINPNRIIYHETIPELNYSITP